MALTITERFRMTAGGRAWRCVEVTHDGSVLSVSAGSLDLSYIDFVAGYHCYVSMQANASIPLQLMTCSINASNNGIVWAESDANAVSYMTVVGW